MIWTARSIRVRSSTGESRCGSAASLPKLRAFIDDPATPDTARRIALESVRLLLTPEERAEAARQVLDGLPVRLAAAVRRGAAEEVLDELHAVLEEEADHRYRLLLRTHGRRPCRCDGEQRDEIAAPHFDLLVGADDQRHRRSYIL